MRRIVICALGLLTILFAGCCRPCREYQKLQQPLVGTSWQLIQLNGRKVTPADEQFTLQFSPSGELSGQGACNRLMGSYTMTSYRALKIGPLASTRRLCSDAREQEFFSALERTTHYDMDGPLLLLLSEGNLLAIFDSDFSIL